MTTGIKNKARSIMYILIIGGLLSSTAVIIMLVWNKTLSGYFQSVQISFLESVGLVSFVYVIYYGIKFGHESCQNDVKTDIAAERKSSSDKMTEFPSKISSDLLKKIPDENKKEFKEFISKCCGMSHNDKIGYSSFGKKSTLKDI